MKIKLFLEDIIIFFLTKFKLKMKNSEVWIFNSGSEFSGNVKYLFLYMCSNRKDIRTCYLTNGKKALSTIRSSGYRAYEINSLFGRIYSRIATVYVTEQFKEDYPVLRFKKDIKLLNLWHGVGLKSVEKRSSIPNEEVDNSICKKYIKLNNLLTQNTLFLVTSSFMENHFKFYCDLNENQLIRAGYPRNSLKDKSYSLLRNRIKDKITKSNYENIYLYVPTYRKRRNFLAEAIPDINKLICTLKATNSLLIVKLHNRISDDFLFKTLASSAGSKSNIILWDNRNDIYEIFDLITIAIVDYSSIFYDLVAAGVKEYIRYIFDYKENSKYLVYDYFKNTCGNICYNFDDLIFVIQGDRTKDYVSQEQLDLIKSKFWSYSKENDCEIIIESALKFKVMNIDLPTFYSFDIFDTLITRKVVDPKAIFLYVQEKIQGSDAIFPEDFYHNYQEIRVQSEQNAREENRKTIGNYEIKFGDIFSKMSQVYELNDQQIEQLKNWEIDAEFDNIIPVKDNIIKCEELIKRGETVVLISDMYLPKEIIRAMIEKVSPIIAKIPMYISSESGYQKTTTKLYRYVFKSFAPWRFKEWRHYGDNSFADGRQARKLCIKPTIHKVLKFNDFEMYITQKNNTYDSYLLAGLLAHFRSDNQLDEKEYFAFAHVSGYLYHYIAWAVHDAIRGQVKTLYFISRDGFILKKIADKVIELEGLHSVIKTKYIYGSRKAWRLASQIDSIDNEFFSEYGNIVGIKTYDNLLNILRLSDGQFREMFPELIDKYNKVKPLRQLRELREYLSQSQVYKKYLISIAKQDRVLVDAYLNQEIDFSEKFAFIEYWGRGYTQDCLSKLLSNCAGHNVTTIFYYYRSIYRDNNNCRRRNYSTKNNSLLIVEAIFANHPHDTVLGYKMEDGVILPLAHDQQYDEDLLNKIELYVLEFADQFNKLNTLRSKEVIGKIHSNTALDWIQQKPVDKCLVESIAPLKDAVVMNSDKKEFAPPIGFKLLYHMLRKQPIGKYTKSLSMSYERSSWFNKCMTKLICRQRL